MREPVRVAQLPVAEETRIVWLEDITPLDYVRESTYVSMRCHGRPGIYGRSNPRLGRLVGYADLVRKNRHREPCCRRFFWLAPHDRDSDPDGVYRTCAPSEAVDPRTIAPGKPG